MAYNIFLALHVLFAGIWVACLPAFAILNKLRKKAANTSSEVAYMAAAGRIGLIMGNMGAIGILLTGPALEGMNEAYGWFQFGEQNWLAWKQTIFVLGIIMTGAVIIPRAKRMRGLLMEHLAPNRGNTGASEELRAAFQSYVTAAMILNTLVLINIFLAELKP